MIFLSDDDMLLHRAAGAGGGPLDRHAPTTLGGLRRERHEGARQRRHQPLGIGRLVGGGLYTSEVGWALGDGREHGDDPAWDALEAHALCQFLEREVVSEFYARDLSGIPTAWVKRMRESMARLTPRYSSNRAVREYTELHYLSAAADYDQRAANKGAIGRQIVDWRHMLDRQWGTLRFGDIRVETDAEHSLFTILFMGSTTMNEPKAFKKQSFTSPIR